MKQLTIWRLTSQSKEYNVSPNAYQIHMLVNFSFRMVDKHTLGIRHSLHLQVENILSFFIHYLWSVYDYKLILQNNINLDNLF